jgi:peptidoglycan/xylan/chitin deacetylase (PgdA/CDA1 family)
MSKLQSVSLRARDAFVAARRAAEPWRPWTRSPARQIVDLPWYSRPRPAEVALTFDDGPHPTHTAEILDLLAAHGATATFFMCGVAADAFPDLVKRAAAEGHTVAGHTWTHRSLLGRPRAEVAEELDRTHELLEELSGQTIRLFRPPWGQLDEAAGRELGSRSLTPVLWSTNSDDHVPGKTAGEISSQVLAQSFPGAIALLHDSRANDFTDGVLDLTEADRSETVTAVATIVRHLAEAGLRVRALRTQEP